MKDDRAFLHDISNSLAVVKVSMELLQEEEDEKQLKNTDRQQLWERAMKGLRQLQDAIVAQRAKQG